MFTTKINLCCLIVLISRLHVKLLKSFFYVRLLWALLSMSIKVPIKVSQWTSLAGTFMYAERKHKGLWGWPGRHDTEAVHECLLPQGIRLLVVVKGLATRQNLLKRKPSVNLISRSAYVTNRTLVVMETQFPFVKRVVPETFRGHFFFYHFGPWTVRWMESLKKTTSK